MQQMHNIRWNNLIHIWCVCDKSIGAIANTVDPDPVELYELGLPKKGSCQFLAKECAQVHVNQLMD